MGRNAGGSYTAPSADFVSGTVINSNVMNAKLADLGAELTNSLDRSGRGGMLAPLRGPDGTSNLPAYAFTSETTLGLYRAGSGDLRASSNGTDLQKWSTAEVRVYTSAFFADGLTVDDGGLTVTAGGATVTAGGATVSAGGLTARTAMPASGSTGSLNKFITGTTGTDEMASTTGNNYPLAEVESFTHNANSIRLAVRALNRDTVTDWEQVGLGLSYDVDTTLAAGGSFFLGKPGAVLTGGTAATATDPTNCLELTNGNLKLSGTAPAKDEGLSNTLTPANIPLAWGHLVTVGNSLGGTSTVVTVTDGFNITSAAASGTNLNVTLASAISAPGAPVATAAVDAMGCTASMPMPTTVRINAYPFNSVTAHNFETAGSRTINFVVFGRQP